MDKIRTEATKKSLEKIYNVANSLLNNKVSIVDLYVEKESSLYSVPDDAEEEFTKILINDVKTLLRNIQKVENLIKTMPFDFKLKTKDYPFETIEDFELAAEILSFEAIELGTEIITELEIDLTVLSSNEKTNIDDLEKKNDELVFLKTLIDTVHELSAEIEIFFDIEDEEDGDDLRFL